MHFNITSPSVRSYSSTRVNVNSSRWALTQKSQRDWSLRLSREFEFVKKLGGSTLFITFTFDDEHLPLLKRYDFSLTSNGSTVCESLVLNDKGEFVKCFDNEKISESVMRGLRDLGYVLKYVVFPEYGSDDYYYDDCGRLRKGTQRPHYHCVIFVYSGFDLDIIKTQIFGLWSSCQAQCLDCVEINENYGFSTYVSKYVSKGIDKDVFPASYYRYISHHRNVIKKFRECDFKCLSPEFQKYVSHSVYCLHCYEISRPKVLSSNNIGSSKYSDKDIFNGCTKIKYQHKDVEVSIPSYNVRKQTNDVGFHFVKRYWHVKDGRIVFCRDNRLKRYHFTLTSFGQDCADNWRSLRYDDLKTKLDALRVNSTPFSFDARKYLESVGWSVDADSPFTALKNVFHEVEEIFKGVSLVDLLFYYRSFYSCHSLWQLEHYYNFDFRYFDFFRDYVSFARSALDTQFDFDLSFDSCPCTQKSGYLEDYDDFVYKISLLNDFVNDIFNALSYGEYMQRKLDFASQKRVNDLLFRPRVVERLT